MQFGLMQKTNKLFDGKNTAKLQGKKKARQKHKKKKYTSNMQKWDYKLSPSFVFPSTGKKKVQFVSILAFSFLFFGGHARF